MSVDLPTSLVSIDETTLNDDQKEAYNSLNKLNMLGFRLTEDNREEYEAELAQVKEILKNEKYEELFRGSIAGEGRIVVKMVGEENAIDELIVFVSANDKGFAIIRVLGDNMEPFKVMQLGNVVKDVSSQENGVQDFMKFFN